MLTVLVDTDGDLDELASVLVADVDAVLSGVIGSDFVDHQTGKFTPIKCDPGVFVAHHFLLILEPCDLGCWLAPYGAGQAQRLQERPIKSRVKTETLKTRGATAKSSLCAFGFS